MSENLENKISNHDQFKSAGEKKIAGILDKYGISFKYESPVIVIDNDKKQRIWYPDFFLPEYGIYIEFYGFAGNPEYDNGTAKKSAAYARNGIETLSIFATKVETSLERHLVSHIYSVLDRRLREYGQKISRVGLQPATGDKPGSGRGYGPSRK